MTEQKIQANKINKNPEITGAAETAETMESWQLQLDKTYLIIMRFVILFFSALIFSVFSPRLLYFPIFLASVSFYLLFILAGIFIAYLKTDWKYYEHFAFFAITADLFFAHLIVFLSGDLWSSTRLLYTFIIIISLARFPTWKFFSFFGFLGGGGFIFLTYLFKKEIFFKSETILFFIIMWFTAFATSIFIIFSERSREYLKKMQFLQERIIGAFPDGLIMYDSYGKIQVINDKIEEFSAVNKDDIQGKYITEILASSLSENLNKIFSAKRQINRPTEIEISKPERRILEISVLPISGDGDNIIGFIAVLHDITREKTIEKLKTEFVSIAAHQLRTPLSAIKWSLKMLLEGDIGALTKEQIQFLEQSYKSNERMIRLINDLLNVARIEEGKFIYEFAEVQIEELIENLVQELKPFIDEKKVRVIIHSPSQKLPKARIDYSKMRLALQNIIDNAVKYTPSGGLVEIFAKSDEEKLEISVKDSGVGIPQSQIEKVFYKFFRGNNAIKMETDGSGLGLFIVKNIIESHKGKIRFETRENQGTTFYITLPLRKSPEEEKEGEKEFEKFITGF